MSREFFTYNCLDAIACLEIFYPIMEEITKEGNMDAYNSAVSLINPLMAMQYRGMRFDTEGIAAQSAQAEAKIAELQEKLNTKVGREVNVVSFPQLKKLFYIEYGVQPYVKRGTGNVSLDEE